MGAGGGATTGGAYVAGNTTGQSSSSTYALSSFNISGAGIISAGWSNSSLIISAPASTGISQSLYATSNTTQSTSGSAAIGSILFAGAGNVSVGVSNGSVVISGGSAAAAPVNFSAGTTSNNLATVVFSNSNGVGFGLNGSTITASYTVPTQSTQPVAYSAANGSAAFSTLTFANSNGVSFSTGTQGLYATVATNYQSSNANYLTSQSNQAASASNGSFAFQTLGFSNANNVTFGTSAGSIISASVLAQSVQTQASGNIAGTGVTTTTQAGSTLGVTQNTAGLSLAIPAWLTVAAGGGAAISAAGNSVNNGTVVFSNNAQISFGMAGSTITGSVNAGAAAGIAGMNNSNATYTSGTVQLTEGGGAITIASGTGQRFAFSVPQTSSLVGTNGISIATAGSTISIDGTALSAALPVPYTALSFANRQLGVSSLTTAGAGSLWISPVRLVAPLSASTGIAMISITGSASSATSGQFGLTASYGLYSQNSGTTGRFDSWFTTSLSASAFFTTGSVTYAFNGGSTSSTTSNGLTGFYGPRIIQFPIGTTMQTGVWLLVSGLSSSTAGYASFVRTCGAVIDNPASFGMGTFGQATNASVGYVDGGIWTTTTAAMPASMSIGDIKHTNNAMPFFMIGAL